jgi:hypothetical protein
LVRADGTIAIQSGGISVTTHPAPGVYVLDFGSNVGDKLILASNSFASSGLRGAPVAGPCGGPPGGFVNCSPFNTDNNHVIVFTVNTAGVSTDAAVYVAVIG